MKNKDLNVVYVHLPTLQLITVTEFWLSNMIAHTHQEWSEQQHMNGFVWSLQQ